MTFTDIYFQPDAPDPVLDEQTVREAARRHAPHAGRLLQVDESGGEARAYHLEGDIVLKTQRPHRLRPRTSLAKEEFVLRALERAGDLPVPRVLGYGHAQGIEYLCLTRMPGASLRNIELKPPQRAAALEELGRTLRRLHEIDQSPLANCDLLPGDRSPADLHARFADSFERLAETLDQTEGWHDALDVRAIAATRLADTPGGTNPVALHSNPGPSTPSSRPKAAASAASSTSATPTAATPHSTCAPGTTKRTHTPYSPATSHPAPYPRASNTSGAPGS